MMDSFYVVSQYWEKRGRLKRIQKSSQIYKVIVGISNRYSRSHPRKRF